MQGHETLLAWQLARSFVLHVYRVTVSCWCPQYSAVIDQLRRSALSVQLNIAEGYALGTPGLFAKHLAIAYGSGVEAVDALGLLMELIPMTKTEFAGLSENGKRCCRVVLGLKHATLRSVPRRGDAR